MSTLKLSLFEVCEEVDFSFKDYSLFGYSATFFFSDQFPLFIAEKILIIAEGMWLSSCVRGIKKNFNKIVIFLPKEISSEIKFWLGVSVQTRMGVFEKLLEFRYT